jgi:hypothetical protein
MVFRHMIQRSGHDLDWPVESGWHRPVLEKAGVQFTPSEDTPSEDGSGILASYVRVSLVRGALVVRRKS